MRVTVLQRLRKHSSWAGVFKKEEIVGSSWKATDGSPWECNGISEWSASKKTQWSVWNLAKIMPVKNTLGNLLSTY